jgi:hypothetical protein
VRIDCFTSEGECTLLAMVEVAESVQMILLLSCMSDNKQPSNQYGYKKFDDIYVFQKICTGLIMLDRTSHLTRAENTFQLAHFCTESAVTRTFNVLSLVLWCWS